MLIAGALAVQLHAHDLAAGPYKDVRSRRVPVAHLARDLDDLDAVSKLRPGAQAMLTQAGLNFRTRHFKAAERAALRATKREPDNYTTWLTVGVARQSLGNTRGARAAFARAHALNPLYPIPR